jgi:hypothetical protein
VCCPAQGKNQLKPDDHQRAGIDASFSIGQAVVIAAGMTPVIGIIVLGTYSLVWGVGSLLGSTLYFRQLHILIPTLAISIVAHELLHGLGYLVFAGLSWRSIRFGFNLRSLAAYAHADAPVRASAYRLLVGLPAVVLGVVPVCVGIAWEGGILTLYGFFMLISASGDIAVLWKIRRLSPHTLVMDHPSRAGCLVVAETGDNDTLSLPSEQ